MPSDANLIAERYVRALFDLATESAAHDNVKKDVLTLKEMLEKSDELPKFLLNPTLTRQESQKAMDALLQGIHACELTRKFFNTLAAQRRLALAEIVIAKYLHALAESRGELVVQVASATPLNQEQLRVLSDVLSKATKKKIDINVSENPALLGGLQLKIGSQLFDNSISGKLDRLKASLNSAA